MEIQVTPVEPNRDGLYPALQSVSDREESSGDIDGLKTSEWLSEVLHGAMANTEGVFTRFCLSNPLTVKGKTNMSSFAFSLFIQVKKYKKTEETTRI